MTNLSHERKTSGLSVEENWEIDALCIFKNKSLNKHIILSQIIMSYLKMCTKFLKKM